MKIQFLLPSKSRPKKFFDTINNLVEFCMTEDYGVTAILDESDATMNTKLVKETILSYPHVKAFFVKSTGKVNAINSGLKYLPPDYEILVLIADDIRFTEKGFDIFIAEDMQRYFPKLDGLLHYPDDIPQAGERQITMPVIGRRLIEQWGYVYHPSFVSTWCDNFQLSVVKILNKHKYIPRHFYSHLHPAFGKGENDDLYKHNESFYQQDSDTYFKHLANNFGL